MLDKIFKKVFFAYLFLYPLIPSFMQDKYHLCDLLMLLFIGLFFIKSIHTKNERKKLKFRIRDSITDPILITMCISIIIMVISSSYAVNKGRSFQEAFRFITYGILYIAIKYEFKLQDNKSRYYVLFMLQTFIAFVLGILQYFTKIGVKVNTNGTLRMESTLGYPTAYAAYIVIVMFPLIMFFINTKHKKLKIATGINILLGLISIVLSWSRNGWLALVVGLVVLAVIYNYKFIYAILIGGTFGFIVPFIRERLMQLTSSAINGGRIKLWKIAVLMIKEHPVKGVGMGNYVDLVNDYYVKYPNLYEKGQEGFPTHNSYLKMWAETGIIGMIAFFSTYLVMGIKLFKTNKKYKNNYMGLTIGVCASFIAFLFINIFDNMMFTPKVMTIFIALMSICITFDTKEYYLEG